VANAVSLFEELLGPDHPNTIHVRGNLAMIQQAIEQQNGAS
jgi:hypothetical protein